MGRAVKAESMAARSSRLMPEAQPTRLKTRVASGAMKVVVDVEGATLYLASPTYAKTNFSGPHTGLQVIAVFISETGMEHIKVSTYKYHQ